jgi:hypothetical protein
MQYDDDDEGITRFSQPTVQRPVGPSYGHCDFLKDTLILKLLEEVWGEESS